MGTIPVSATLDAARVAEAKSRVGERQFSRYLDEALALRLQNDRLADLDRELEAEFGPIPDEIRRQIDATEWPR
ncbi:MAG: hypothetical protein MUE82_09885 [Chloroflexi bacterium]|nr:hypothetical protein [Chloroflexota bacterium]